MKNSEIKRLVVLFAIMACFSCEKDFLERVPLNSPSLETFWETEEQAEMWVNNLYNGLGGVEEAIYEAYSDNGFGRAGDGANNIANGTFEANDADVNVEWNYRYIRLGLEFFENVDQVSEMSQAKLDELSGQVR